MTEGAVFTFADITNTDCFEVGLVEAYAPNTERDSVIGAADVSMEGQGLFTLLVAFDAEGQRLQATRLGRTPYDMNDFGTTRISCDNTYAISGGEIVRARRLVHLIPGPGVLRRQQPLQTGWSSWTTGNVPRMRKSFLQRHSWRIVAQPPQQARS